MKIQTKLSINTSLVFGIIFVITSGLIFGLYYQNAKKNIYEKLESTAYLTAWFYLEEDELNEEEYKKIKTQFKEEVLNHFYQIYNQQNKIAYGTSDSPVPEYILTEFKNKKELSFSYDDFLCYGMFYEDNQGNFIVVTKEKKEILIAQTNLLLWILGIALIVGMATIILLSKWMASRAYKPFKDVILQVNNISSNNFYTQQIASPQTKDELEDLTNTFNNLLQRISESFIIQKNFVSYISHEFKTPLASILGNLEVFAFKKRTSEEYEDLSNKLIEEISQLESILNTLIVVSDLRDISAPTSSSRIDEVIWEIIHRVQKQYESAHISFEIDIPSWEEPKLSVLKDRTHLLMALFNIIENAVKYSQRKQVEIKLLSENEILCLFIKDSGIGIPAEQLAHVSKPFYRADNATEVKGCGIGLSIALRILEKNRIDYQINSKEHEGTEIKLYFS